MTKPGKDLQDIVKRIESALGEDCEVTSPDWLEDRTSGRKREVDLSIRQKVGGQSVLIIEECRDHKRKVGVQYIEQAKQKRDDVKANKLVVVSTEGFTRGAKEKAEHHGIALMTMTEALEEDWGSWFQVEKIDVYTHRFELVNLEILTTQGADTETAHGIEHLGQFKSDAPVLFNEDGSPWGSANLLLQGVAEQHGSKLFGDLNAGDEPKLKSVDIALNHPLVLKQGKHAVTFDKVRATAKFWTEVTHIPFNRMQYRGASGNIVAEYAAATMDIPGGPGKDDWTAEIFFVRDEEGVRVGTQSKKHESSKK